MAPKSENFTKNGDHYDMTVIVSVPEANETKPNSDEGGCFGTGPGGLLLFIANLR